MEFGFLDAQDKETIELVCRTTTDSWTLSIARFAMMKNDGQAARHLDHFLGGSGADLRVDLRRLLSEDAGVRELAFATMRHDLRAGRRSGRVLIRQANYRVEDWRLALGAMRLDWKLDGRSVKVVFRDQYRWHPNESRVTQCVHQAADRLHRSGRAMNYWMVGEVQFDRGDLEAKQGVARSGGRAL